MDFTSKHRDFTNLIDGISPRQYGAIVGLHWDYTLGYPSVGWEITKRKSMEVSTAVGKIIELNEGFSSTLYLITGGQRWLLFGCSLSGLRWHPLYPMKYSHHDHGWWTSHCCWLSHHSKTKPWLNQYIPTIFTSYIIISAVCLNAPLLLVKSPWSHLKITKCSTWLRQFPHGSIRYVG